MRTADEIADEIEVINDEILEINSSIENFELDNEKYEEQYRELLNEEVVVISGISFDPAQILEELDPTAYNEGLSDYTDSLSLTDDDEYNELVNELEELETKLEELEEELEELEEEEDE